MIIPNEIKERRDAQSNIRNLTHYGRGGTLLDLGANVGFFAVEAARYFDKVVCYEANPNTFDRLRDVTWQNPNIYVYNSAVWDVNAELLSSNPKNSTGATVTYWPRRKIEGYYSEVKGTSFQSILDSVRPRVIKCDIEGTEYRIFPEARINQECEWISIEFHGCRSPGGYEKVLQIEWKLMKEGFTRVKPENLSLMTNRAGHLMFKSLFFISIFTRIR